MSLSYDLSEIPDSIRTIVATQDEPAMGIKAGDILMNPITKTIIFATITTGIGRIRPETVDEFASRLEIWQALNGPLMNAWDEETHEWKPRPIVREDIAAHVGLTTNVFPYETRAKWVKRIVGGSFAKPEPKYSTTR